MNSRDIRNVIGGLLVGCGITSLAFGIVASGGWCHAAPLHPDSELGFLYRCTSGTGPVPDGPVHYLPAFQAIAEYLLFYLSIPMSVIGGAILPRKTVGRVYYRNHRRRVAFDLDDPKRLMKRSIFLGVVLTPFFLYFLGPFIVRGLTHTPLLVWVGAT